MKKVQKNRRKKKEESIYSGLIYNIENFKFIEVIFKILNLTFKKVVIKIPNNEVNQKANIEKDKLITKKLQHCCYLIILIFISTIFKVINQDSIINGNSVITLKVSQNGHQKIINDETYLNKVLIDDANQALITNYYTLNTANIVTLIWIADIVNCINIFKDCDTILEINFTNFDAKKNIYFILYIKINYLF